MNLQWTSSTCGSAWMPWPLDLATAVPDNGGSGESVVLVGIQRGVEREAPTRYDFFRKGAYAIHTSSLPLPSPTTSFTMDGSSSTSTLFHFLHDTITQVETTFYKIPGSHVVARYVKSSHQNHPGRTLLELLLFFFLVRTVLQRRTRADHDAKHFIQFSEKVCIMTINDAQPLRLFSRKLMSWLMNGHPNPLGSL